VTAPRTSSSIRRRSRALRAIQRRLWQRTPSRSCRIVEGRARGAQTVVLGVGFAPLSRTDSQQHAAAYESSGEQAYSLAEAALNAQIAELSVAWPTQPHWEQIPPTCLHSGRSEAQGAIIVDGNGTVCFGVERRQQRHRHELRVPRRWVLQRDRVRRRRRCAEQLPGAATGAIATVSRGLPRQAPPARTGIRRSGRPRS
jgi:hypothetical protein